MAWSMLFTLRIKTLTFWPPALIHCVCEDMVGCFYIQNITKIKKKLFALLLWANSNTKMPILQNGSRIKQVWSLQPGTDNRGTNRNIKKETINFFLKSYRTPLIFWFCQLTGEFSMLYNLSASPFQKIKIFFIYFWL